MPIAKTAAAISRRPWIVAAAIACAVGLWLLSGQLGGSEATPEATGPMPDHATPMLTDVLVRTSHAEPLDVLIEIRGRTLPWMQAHVAAEVEGRVTEVYREIGDTVQAGDPLLKIDPRARSELLRQAKALTKQRELEYAAAQRLNRDRVLSDAQLAQALTLLETARTDERNAALALEHTVVRSPISGRLESRDINVGDYLKVGAVAAAVADIRRLKLEAFVSERDIRALSRGQQVTLSGPEELPAATGTVHFVAKTSDAQTRTYRVEVAIDNPRGYPAGESVRGHIAVGTEQAHAMSIGYLDLADDGSLGIIGLPVDSDVVERFPVSIIRTQSDRAWLGGLPQTVRIITRGQGYVTPGERVSPTES